MYRAVQLLIQLGVILGQLHILRDTYSNLTCSNNGIPDSIGCQTTGDVPNLNANFVPSNLNSLLGDNTTVTHEEVQAGNVITGNYKLGHNTKVALAWNNPASVMDTGLESLSSDNIIINVDVTRQRVDKWGSHIWTVTYTKKTKIIGPPVLAILTI